jgi:hypothetical protein
MIVKKMWITTKKYSLMRDYTLYWYGYFLFGFLPIYLVNYKLEVK